MPCITDHKQKFADLDFNINNKDQLRRRANGGNSILFSYQSDEEALYIGKARKLYPDNAEFIDVSKLLVKFICSPDNTSVSKNPKGGNKDNGGGRQ